VARTPLARPTDAPPTAQRPGGEAAPSVEPVRGDALDDDRLLPDRDLPKHVAIIMDGNRRWARQRGLAEVEGHAAGVEAIRTLLRHAVRRGVPVVTVYAFSRENWARSDDEVRGLFALLEHAIRSETAELKAQGVRIRLLGRLDELPDDTRRSINEALAETAAGKRLLLNVAFNYAGRTELVDAFRRLAASGVDPASIDETAIADALYTSGLPDPDLVIRTGGEQRLSNFLIWQAAYAELYTTEVLWPDFGADAFDAALLEFANRTRRFGR
jgi:undecaprenyl diphosphate synthase